jgi:serine/threonine protein kinase
MSEPAPDLQLTAMLRSDQRLRWTQGERIPVEAYLDHYPGLSDNPDSLLDLIEHELKLREELGEVPKLDEYRRRFPRLAERLAECFRRRQPLTGPTTATRGDGDPAGDNTPTETGEEGPVAWPTIPGYEVFGELGRGGMGVVYLARQAVLNRRVAIKMIRAGDQASERELKRFQSEAETIARLQHPNIVQIYEVASHGGLPYLALELAARGSLASRLTGEPLNPTASAELVELVARAVHAVHEQGIIHRDLKPANILLADPVPGSRSSVELEEPGPSALDFGVPKITDFGLAKRLDNPAGPTKPGSILGTPSYMAPEQAEAKAGAVGPATDVHALGAILYELLTGHKAYLADTNVSTLMQVISQGPIAPRVWQPRLQRDLETITLKCLRKDPRQRYASALELAEDLYRFRRGLPIKARATPFWRRARHWLGRHPELVYAIAGALLATAIILLLRARG